MNLQEIENGTFKAETYTFNKGEMKFIVCAMFNYFTDFYEEHGLEDGEDMFQDFCNMVQNQFEEVERDDINSVLKTVGRILQENEKNG